MKNEMSMEVRLLLAFGLMGLVLLVSQYFMKPVPPTKPVAAKTEAPATAGDVAKKPVVEEAAKPAIAATKPTNAKTIEAGKEETTVVDTDRFHVVFSNRGAVVRNWTLKGYKDHAGKPLDVVYQPALTKVAAPFSLNFREQGPSADANQVLYKTTKSGAGLDVAFEYSKGHANIRKSFHFEQASYLVGVNSEVLQDGVALQHTLMWRGGFGDPAVQNPTSVQHALYYDLPNNKLQSKVAKDAKDGAVGASGQFSFVGIEDSYFAAAFLPGNKSQIDQVTYADNVPDKDGKDELRVGMGAGVRDAGAGENQLSIFVGPKDTNLLRKVDPKLEQLVDWGFFGIIAKPLFEALNWTAEHVSGNFGWAIVLVTLAINILLFPLKISSLKSSKKMQALKPQVDAINAKYKDLSIRDPKKSEQQQEVMDLYKKNDVNIAGGCLPLLVQMPFLYAFYKVLSVAIAMRGAHWLWVNDLSQPEALAIHMLPILLVATQFLTQKMTPATPGMDPSQQKMMMFMPLMFGYMFYFASAGLVLYWLTGNVVAIGQQWLLNKWMPAPTVTRGPKELSKDVKKKGK